MESSRFSTTATAENKEVVRTLFTAMNDHDAAAVNALCSDERTQEALGRFMGAFPDMHLHPGWLIGEDDIVAAWIDMEGTHGGPFRAIPATGKTVRSSAIYALRLRDGKVCDYWLAADWLGMLEQLGVVQITRPAG